ncbi:MAG: TIGR04086 family membrane protein [Firmicutes bacterium]|nr:TIGR04086 family membrane protein [Bacillota bacterium]
MKTSKFKPLLSGLGWSLGATVFLVLFMALFIMLGLGGGMTTILVQITKVISIFFGVGMALKSVEGKGWLYGGIIGLIYTLLAFLIFSVVDVDFGISTGIFVEMLFASVVGMFSALLLRGFRRH